jgi:hypothetical protein
MFARVASTLSREDVGPLAEKRNGKPIEGTWMTVLQRTTHRSTACSELWL